MNSVRTRLAVLVAFLAATASLAAQTRIQHGADAEALPEFQWVEGLEMDLSALQGRAGAAQGEESLNLSMRFFMGGRQYDLSLEPARLFAEESRNIWVGADGARWEEVPEQIFFSGQINGEAGSQVRMVIHEDEEIEGLVMTDQDLFFLEPARRFFPGAAASETVAYRLDSSALALAGHECSLDSSDQGEGQFELEEGLPQAGAALRAWLDEVRLLAGSSTNQEIEIRLVADSLYYQINGGASASRMQGIIHQINAIYEQQAGLTFRITETRVWTNRSQDQVGSVTDAGDLLDEFSTVEQVAGNDLVHFFTGRDLDGGTVGMARVGGICNASQATSLSQDLPNAQLRTILAAHELGHNLGSRHDGQRSCSDVPSGFIMWPALSTSFRQFSDCSLGAIARRMERAECVAVPGNPLPAPLVVAPDGEVLGRFPAFQWQSVAGADSYRVQVYDESEGRLVIDQFVSQESYQPSEPLTRLHNYRWRAAAADSGGEGEQSPWLHFGIQALAAPQAVAPSGSVQTSRPRFQWKPVEGAAAYLLEVVDEEGDAQLESETQQLDFQPSQDLKGARFRWRVSTVDEAGSLSLGPWMRFALRSARPSTGPRDRP